jgi:hypothetical protein
MRLRTLLPAFLLSASLSLAACGSDESTNASEEQATPEQAIAEIGAVRAALDDAVAAVKSGDAAQADEALSEGYVEHFEKVEGPLDKVDHELNEELEDTIREELREQIRAGADEAKVARLVRTIDAKLDEAKQALASS